MSAMEKALDEYESGGLFNEVKFVYSDGLTDQLQKSQCDFLSFQLKTTPSCMKFRKSMLKQEHFVQNRPIGDTNLRLFRRFSVEERLCVTGCLLLPNKDIVLVATGALYFLDDVGGSKSKLSLEIPYDATVVNSDTIATTDDCRITFVDITNKQVINKYFAETYGFGITYENGNLLYASSGKKVYKMDTNSKTINATQIECREYQCYISSANGKNFISNWSDNTVTCYDDNGREMWRFQNENVLKYPAGLSLDNQGNVFVAGTESNNIVIISSNGQQFKEMKLNDSGIQRPRAIHLCNTNRLVLVCSEKGLAAIYSVH